MSERKKYNFPAGFSVELAKAVCKKCTHQYNCNPKYCSDGHTITGAHAGEEGKCLFVEESRGPVYTFVVEEGISQKTLAEKPEEVYALPPKDKHFINIGYRQAITAIVCLSCPLLSACGPKQIYTSRLDQQHPRLGVYGAQIESDGCELK